MFVLRGKIRRQVLLVAFFNPLNSRRFAIRVHVRVKSAQYRDLESCQKLRLRANSGPTTLQVPSGDRLSAESTVANTRVQSIAKPVTDEVHAEHRE